ncbi:hypothetical protein LguiA_008317 [Lonicera macranthoides]
MPDYEYSSARSVNNYNVIIPPAVAASAEAREGVNFLSMDGTQRPQLFME